MPRGDQIERGIGGAEAAGVEHAGKPSIADQHVAGVRSHGTVRRGRFAEGREAGATVE